MSRIAALCCSVLLPWIAQAWEGGWLDELAPAYPDTKAEPALSTLTIDVPRHSLAGAHLLLSGIPAGTPITVSAAGKDFPVSLYRLVDVPVEENTGVNSRTERFGGGINPSVIRRAPFRIFEALEPCDGHLVAGKDTVTALRIEVAIPALGDCGGHGFPVTVTAGGTTKTFQLNVQVHPATVPALGKDSFGYTNWFSVGAIAKAHKVDLWSEPFWTVLDNYAALMARGRQNTFLLHLGDFFTKQVDGSFKFERDRLQRYVKTFEQHGLWLIEGGHLAGRTGGQWGSKTLDFSIGGGRTDTPEAAARLDQILKPLAAEIKANGWEGRWLQHIADEPSSELVPAYKALADEARKRLPAGVRLFDATMTQELDGVVDAWCPQVQEYQGNRKFFDGQLAQHRNVWVYTCLIPGGKWLNRLLDQERLRPVYLCWSLEKYQLDGFLHWGGTYWSADPFGKSIVPNEQAPGTKNYLPAGDTHVWYPGPDRPWSTTRFEAHRIGLEDAELLRKLRLQNPQLHDQLMQDNLRAYNDYNTDVAKYRACRRLLLDAVK
jgi:hypothetical protein